MLEFIGDFYCISIKLIGSVILSLVLEGVEDVYNYEYWDW